MHVKGLPHSWNVARPVGNQNSGGVALGCLAGGFASIEPRTPCLLHRRHRLDHPDRSHLND